MGATVARDAEVGHLVYMAEAGEENTVELTDNAVEYVFTDPAGITAGHGCSQSSADPTEARCAKSGASGIITIDVGDQDDDVTVTGVDYAGLLERGGPGDDALRGSDGSATSSLIGGPGTDTYEAPGPQFDAVIYDEAGGVTASLDDVANDPDGENVPSTVDALGGGSGDDVLYGSDGPEYLLGGTGDDQLDARGGFDILIGHEGDDTMDGGPGTDMADYRYPGYVNLPADVTLDDVANDGNANENDNVLRTEWILGSYGADDLTGNAGANRIRGDMGNDTITGGAGADDLRGEYGDDTINSRDGEADEVSCGSGQDTANADEHDDVALDCENVTRADPPPPAEPQPAVAAGLADAPPTVSFEAPAENARLSPRRPSTVTVAAGDDHGVARVELLDDGRVIATDTSAPYEFSYRPKLGDIGRNTLTARAVDTTSQEAGAVRAVRVARFKPGLRVRMKRMGESNRFRVTGRVLVRAPLARARACRRGRVALALRWGDLKLARERVRIRRSCRFRAIATVRPGGLAGSDRLWLRARFRGNALLRPVSRRT
jgi:hypothetical protein